MTPKTERFEMRLDEGILSRIDSWRADEADLPSRAEAVRRLVEQALAARGDNATRFSDGEKLLLLAMRDLFTHLKIKDPDTDLDFISQVIFGGHYWAPKWRMTGVFHGHQDNPERLREVLDILDMWDCIERGYGQLSKKDRQRLAEEEPVFGTNLKFRGFDGNTEAEHLGIASFLIDELKRYARFAGRDLNSHMPTHELHERMLTVFRSVPRSMGAELSFKEIAAIVRAMPYQR